MMRLSDCHRNLFPKRTAGGRRAPARFVRPSVLRAVLGAAIACAAFLAPRPAPAAETPEALNAALLTRDLGDPRQPGNVKLVLNLPPALSRMTPRARAEDFRVYVHPAELSREEGLSERYRAGGVYLWRQRNRIFLDARTVPAQDDEGEASVRVVFAPDGVPLAEGAADGTLRYTTDLVDVVLAVDVSRSMLHTDPGKLRVAAARAFIEMARQGGGIGNVGLVTFNHRAAPESPLLPLEEGEILIRALDRVGADGMTNLDNPLSLGMDELAASRKPVIILLTDGKNEGSVYRSTHLRAAERGVRIFTVGLSEMADHALLKEMADATGGIYFRAVQNSDLPEIYARLAAELGKRQMLRAETLDSADGAKTYPVDGRVRRLVVLADGGARVGAAGGSGMFSTGMSGVLMGRPEPGEWTFAWSGAEPGVSTLALFGDTRFFLDVFPPQLLGDRLSLGATLAEGGRPLAGGSVWVDPIPGVLSSRLELFDDGLHRDGAAGDGVYAGTTVLRDAPKRFDVTVKASGAAWDEGDFVRQAVGLAIKAPPAPPEAAVRLEGDVDFGVLFPGESGTADVDLSLDARQDVDLDLDLSWDGAGPDWPDFASSLSVPPGRRALRLEMTVPPEAAPGDYSGTLRVGNGYDIDERARARVAVGTVSFGGGAALDLGVVPPGTFVTRGVALPYHADKAAGLDVRVRAGDGDADADALPDLVATPGAERLAAGDGSLPVEIVVSAPMNRAEGVYGATVRVAAGPGAVDIPVVWSVRQLAAAAPSLAPLAGLPAAPDLPSGARPLERTPEFSRDFWETGPIGGSEPVDSLWDRTEEALRPRDAGGDAGKSGFVFPEVDAPSRKGGSFWSAWWLYILAALLLLLLLLLLLAYILYRLGKSALARFLVLSAIANIILLILFILLLGAGTSEPAVRAAPVSVRLVADDVPADIRFSSAEESLLDGTGSGGGAAEPAPAPTQLTPGTAGGVQTAAEKQPRLSESETPESELSDALQPSAMPLERNEPRPLNRNDRAAARSDRANAMPDNLLAEMAEPPPVPEESAGNARAAEDAALSEARLEIEAEMPSDRPVWSTGEKPVESLAADTGMLLAETAGLETIARDRTARRIDPPGRRRNPREAPAAYPEPRSLIDDPARDAVASEANNADDASDAQSDPGVREVRVAPRSMGADFSGEKPGALLPPAAYRLADAEPERMARGRADNTGDPELSRPVGGARSVRGASAREAAQPAISTAAAAARSGADASSAPERQAAAGAPAAAEQRFDDAPSGAAGGAAKSAGGAPGASRASPASPSPLASGGGAASTDGVPGGSAASPSTGKNAGNPEDGDAPPRRSGSPAGGGGADPANAEGEPDAVSFNADAGDWRPMERRPRSRALSVAASAVDADSLLIVVGDFNRLPDSAAGNLFSGFKRRIGPGLIVEERLLSPADETLPDTLLALATPEQIRSWSEGDVANVADYLRRGGHIWIDGADRRDTLAALDRLAAASGGVFDALPATHPLADRLGVDALSINGKTAAVATAIDWRAQWRFAPGGDSGDGNGGGAMRFLVRAVNYFLSGNADAGIVLEPGEAEGGTIVQPYREIIPDTLSGGAPDPAERKTLWDDFGPGSPASWRMPSWSDGGRLSAISDGQGGRALKLDLDAAAKGRAAAYRALRPAQDFSGVSAVTLDAYYDGAGEAGLSMVFTVGEDGGWRDYESRSVPLRSGWNRLRFELDGGGFRSLSPGGAEDGSLPPSRAETGRVGFFVYRDGASAAIVLFRNVETVHR